MADELVQAAGICGGAWWNIPAKGWYSGGLTSPCSAALGVDMGGSGWLMSEIADVKGTNSIYCEESDSVTDSSVVFPAAESKKPPRPPHQTPDTGGSCSGGSGGLMVDSALQIMGFGLFPSSSSTDWNQQTLLGSDLGAETNYNSLLHEDLDSRLNYGQAANNGMINNSFSSSIVDHHQVYTIDQQPLNSGSSPGNSTTTCEGSGGLPPVSFPLSPTTSYALIQSLLEPDDLQPQVSLFGDSQTLSYSSYPNTYQMNVKNTNSWDRVSPLALDQPNNSLPEEQLNINNNYINTSLMNNTSLINNIPAGLLNPSSLSQSTARGFDERSSCSCPDTKGNAENIHDSRSVIRKSNGEPTSKKPRLETPSPLPTFKVRKEKLGDRITALQQLVSPFGKTDTASVLHEAIEYIKFLHDQVCILSTPYLTSGDSSVQHHQACQPNNEGPKQDLRSRGLCLVPISVTFPVAHETPVDFWTPTLGGTFR